MQINRLVCRYGKVPYSENFEDHLKLEYFVTKFLRMSKYSMQKNYYKYNFEDKYFRDSVKTHKILKIFYPQNQVTLWYLCSNSIVVASSRSDATAIATHFENRI